MINFLKSLFRKDKPAYDEYPAPEVAEPEAVITTTPDPVPAPDVVLCIPGPWPDWNSFVQAMAGDSDSDFLAAGRMLYHRKAQFHMDIVFEGRDPALDAAFRAGAGNRLSEAELAAIANHQSVVYLTAATGSVENAFSAAACARAVLTAGGLGIKVETAGAAFSRTIWDAVADDEIGFVAAFLVLIREEAGSIRSYGLRAFGLRDVQCSGDYPDAVLDEVTNTFIKYLLFENAAVASAETFSIAPDAPLFRLKAVRDDRHKVGHPFHNPYGLIRMEPAQ